MNCDARVSHGAAQVARATPTSARRGGKLGLAALCRNLHRLRTEVRLIRGHSFEALVRPDTIVELEIVPETSVGLADRAVGMHIDRLVFSLRQNRSTNTLSTRRPLPSMLMRMP